MTQVDNLMLNTSMQCKRFKKSDKTNATKYGHTETEHKYKTEKKHILHPMAIKNTICIIKNAKFRVQIL